MPSCPSRDPHGSNQRQQQGEVSEVPVQGPWDKTGSPGSQPRWCSRPVSCHDTCDRFHHLSCVTQVRKTRSPAWVHTPVQSLIHTQQAFRAHVCENEIFIRINLNPLKIHYLESNSFPAWHPSSIVIHTLLATSQLTEVDIGF